MRNLFFILVAQATRLAMVAALILVSVPAAQSGPALPQNGTNLLNNGGFEAFTDDVADGWNTWSLEGEGTKEPRYQKAEATNHVHGGSSAQLVGSQTYDNHDGGLYQQVAGLTVGHAVSFSVWHKWPGDDHLTNAVTVRIGIDPQGGTDAESGSLVWSDPEYATDEWQQMHLTTTASNATVTVFVRSKPNWAFTPGATVEGYVVWDDAVLTSGPRQYVYLPLIARNYVPPCSLQNGGFEGNYTLYDPGHYSNKLVAPHWIPMWEHVEDSLADPEYNFALSPDPVRSGEKTQQYGTFRRFYKAGLYQQLTGCTIGSTFRFSAWGWGYATDKEESSSDPNGDMQMQVGIDPAGGTVFTSTNVIWSSPTANPLDTWIQMSITTTVVAPTVTVFVLSDPAQAWLHNTSYWDDATLEKQP
jgi:hypothetical protein